MSNSSIIASLITIFAINSPLLAKDLIQPKEATSFTKQKNAAVLKELPFHDKQDYVDAQRGFIAALPNGVIKLPDGTDAWNLNTYDFLKKDNCPDTINPSLWRIAQLNLNNGLFKVTDNIYQVRGVDLANMTIIEGNTGIIIVDTLITKETAKAALDLYYANRPKKPVLAVIYTHSHVDHYGGVKGVIDEKDVQSGNVKVIAPAGFLEESVSENIYAGNAMSRRAQYQYGAVLPRGERGQVDAGLGKTTSFGTTTLIPPNVTISQTGETLTIDGVQIEFQMAPGTEAPAEMLVYFPQFKALCAAEDLTHTLHNLYTLRGAKVRDAVKWWKTINEAIERYGDRIDVVLAQHHWPKWGKENIIPYMQKQRDQFKFLHDQSLRLMNTGYTPVTLAETILLPDSLTKEWYNRGYYGSINHDAKAVYQLYLGWYDSNPANLHPLPPAEAAKKYVAFMGGANAVIKQAQKSFEQGEYRWVAEVMKHVVFADPSNKKARELQADAFEQLGYQEENPTWRNEYLMGAYELRNGITKTAAITVSEDVIQAMPVDMILDYLSLCLDGPKVAEQHIKYNMIFPGNAQQKYAVALENGVLVYTADKSFTDADVTITWPKTLMVGIVSGRTSLEQQIKAGNVQLAGDPSKLQTLFGALVTFDPLFPIVTPLQDKTMQS